MALKDLVADQNKITEETIEKIVAPYIRYDPAALKIVFTPQGKALGNEAKVMLFFVAVLGWKYVRDDNVVPPTKPADLERELGIPGGTLRPILKKLKDDHFLTVTDGSYGVQLANIESMEAVIAKRSPAAAAKTSGRRAPTTIREAKTEKYDRTIEPKKKGRGTSAELKTFLSRWTADGFFNEPKTLANLLERYHENGVITRQTSLSGLVLDAVRQGILTRTKIGVGSRQVWAYTARNS